MKTHFPEYGHSLLSLSSSLLKYFGAEARHETLPEMDEALSARPDKTLLLLLDGLGLSILEKHLPESSFLRRHLVCPISSVFPPTTVAATNTVESGLSPIEHGQLGWTLWFDEAGDNVEVFTNICASSRKPFAETNLRSTVLGHPTLWQQIEKADPTVRAHFLSPFAPDPVESERALFASLRRLLREPGRSYIYAYWPEPDHTIHDLGTAAVPVRRIIRRLDRRVRRLCRGLKNSLVAIVADHSLIDTEYLCLQDYPELLELLARRPSIEGRALSLFVRPGQQALFRERFEKAFGASFRLFTHEEVLSLGLFGPGEAHPRAEGFIGDFLAVATDRFYLGYPRDEHPLIGHHAGFTEEEALVPLILIPSDDL